MAKYNPLNGKMKTNTLMLKIFKPLLFGVEFASRGGTDYQPTADEIASLSYQPTADKTAMLFASLMRPLR